MVKDLSATEWLEKVNVYFIMYDWDNSLKIYLAALKLKGIAKSWYDGLKSDTVTWESFSVAIARQFSDEQNFGQLFESAGMYKSLPGQSLSLYCFEKFKKINRLNLDIPEDKVVEFVVHGIHDEQLRTTLLMSKKRSLAKLSQCLGSINVDKFKDTKRTSIEIEKRPYAEQSKSKKFIQRFDRDTCFNCGKSGHKKVSCHDLKGNFINKEALGSHKNTGIEEIKHQRI